MQPERSLRNYLTLLVMLMGSIISIKAQSAVLFRSGDEGYQCFRIPALVALDSKVVVAFAEGRKDNCADFGDVDIVMRRSTDGGHHWGPIEVVVNNGDLQAGNATPLIDRLDPRFPNGRLFLFYNTGTASEQKTREGLGRRQGFFITSTDQGSTWSEPVSISDQTHFDRYNQVKDLDHRTLAYAPGHALQLTYGPFAGRLFVPANHSKGPPQDEFKDYRAFGLYSDDHGASWKVAEDLQTPSSNEVMAAQLPSGELLMTVRLQNNTERNKFLARSLDGGSSWYAEERALDLTSPVCQSSLLYVAGKQKLYHLGPAATDKRARLTLWSSADDGHSWQVEQLIEEGFAAYSDLAYLEKDKLAILYEAEDYSEIRFKLIPIP